MQKLSIIFVLLYSIGIVGCNNTGNSTTTNKMVGNYIQLTPNTGVNINTGNNQTSINKANNMIESNYITTLGTNGNTLYVGTSTGQILRLNSSYTEFSEVDKIESPVVAMGYNFGDGVYYSGYPSNKAQAYPINSKPSFTINESLGYLSAITSSQNGSVFFGTKSGNVGLVNNPADKSIPTVLEPNFGPILVVGCTNAGCNSGQQMILAFQANDFIAPTFESSQFEFDSTYYVYRTKFNYLNISGWIEATYNGTIKSNNQIIIESHTYNVPEFVTTVAINPQTGKLYAGTNLYNIYVANLNCNPGLGCNIKFESTPINNEPLGTFNNGSQGISYISFTTNGNLYVVSNYTESIIGVYTSTSKNT